MTTKKQPKPRRLTVEQMAESAAEKYILYQFCEIYERDCYVAGNAFEAGYLAGYRACQRRNRRTKR